MKTLEKRIKALIYRSLSLNQYLRLVSRNYFILYNSRLLKKYPRFKYHYYLGEVVNKDDVVIDIGANLGYYAVPFSKWVGQDGFVYAVEPVEQMRRVLQRNIGKRKNIKVLPYALGTENKSIRMGNDSRQTNDGVIATGSHFVLDENAHAMDEFSAEMKKGSELFKDLEKLDFIKCDVEGFETVIIPEIREILIKHHPTMLIETRGEKRTFLESFLSDIGYSAYVLDDDKRLYPASDIDEKTEDDVMFIHESRKNSFDNIVE